jgi:hypothetical protein
MHSSSHPAGCALFLRYMQSQLACLWVVYLEHLMMPTLALLSKVAIGIMFDAMHTAAWHDCCITMYDWRVTSACRLHRSRVLHNRCRHGSRCARGGEPCTDGAAAAVKAAASCLYALGKPARGSTGSGARTASGHATVSDYLAPS